MHYSTIFSGMQMVAPLRRIHKLFMARKGKMCYNYSVSHCTVEGAGNGWLFLIMSVNDTGFTGRWIR